MREECDNKQERKTQDEKPKSNRKVATVAALAAKDRSEQKGLQKEGEALKGFAF